jgi:hypothetical protein
MKSLAQMMREMPNYFKVQPPKLSEIEEAEAKLNLSFSPDYIEYLTEIGSFSGGGNEFTGVYYSEYSGRTIYSVVENTIDEREVAENYGYKIPDDFYLIHNLYTGGILIWQNTKGEIFQTIRGLSRSCPPEKIYDSFLDYFVKEIYNPVMEQAQEQ